MNLSDHRYSIHTVINVPHGMEVKCNRPDWVSSFILSPFKITKLSKCSKKMFCLEHKDWFYNTKCFCWWLKDRWLNVSDVHNLISEEIEKAYIFKASATLRSSKLSWIQQLSMLDYKVQQGKTKREDHFFINISDQIQQIELSNPVQSISKSYEHGLSKHEEHQVKKTTSYCLNGTLLQPLKRPKWLKTSRRHLSFLKITLRCIFEDLT